MCLIVIVKIGLFLVNKSGIYGKGLIFINSAMVKVSETLLDNMCENMSTFPSISIRYR